MPIYRLDPNSLAFPLPEWSEADGLLAVGGDLSAERILTAYQMGIFPWFAEGEEILWWSPNPRMLLYPDELKIKKSMRPLFNKKAFRVSFDTDFKAVIDACADFRPQQDDAAAWLSKEMIAAYIELHELGFAHSVEVWDKKNELVGGLYGISLGGCFFGESMFARQSNASKYGLISLVEQLKKWNFDFVDCQVHTQHLESLGARMVDRNIFLEQLKKTLKKTARLGKWQLDSPL